MSKSGEVAVVMVALPAQGHLNQLLHLSRRISAANIPVHFVGAATHNRQAKHRFPISTTAHLHFHDLHIPPFLSPPPDPSAPLKFPSHIIPSLRASSLHLRPPLMAFLLSLSSTARRVVVIHDSLMASAVQGAGSIENVELYKFHSVSAFALSLFCLERRSTSPASESGFGLLVKGLNNIPSLEGCFPEEFLEFVDSQYQLPNTAAGKIYNTSKVIEKPYLEVLERMNREVKHWALGPFNPVKVERETENQTAAGRLCLEWLNRQEPNSVIYVSFGTTTTMEDRQIREIATGLERGEQKFIWVLRDADRGDVFEGGERKCELGEGYEERVGEGGMVVRDWAPQLEILRHSATGGFMSHCGWNSCMESITMGVPVAAWPMHSDQPRNAVLMTEVLKVGVAVREWARHEEVVTAAEVEKAVKKLMASEEGSQMRKRAEEIGDAVRLAVEDGGDSRVELDSFIAHITR